MQNFKPLPDTEIILSFVAYNAVTGFFTRVNSKNCPWTVGQRTGYVSPKGYRLIHIAGAYYMEHRIAWTISHGPIPNGMTIDHINGDKADNRLVNLRLATDCQNSYYRPRKSNNVSGCKGVYKRENGRYRAVITADKKRISLGCFSTKEEAYSAYCAAALELHGPFARLS